MGAYDNPTIIQDLYGAKAWAKAAENLSGTLVKGLTQINAARSAGYEAARKKQEKFSQLEASVTLAKAAKLRAAKGKVDAVGDDDLTTQFLNTAKSYMNGDDNRMGSIEAETLYSTCNGCSKKYKAELLEIIGASADYQDTMIKFAANVTPNLELINDQNQITIDGYFWAGDTTLEQVQNLLTGNYLDNTSLKGVKSTKNLETNYENGSNTLKVDHKIKLGTHIAQTIQEMGIDLTDEKQFPVDEEGYVTIPTFEKDVNIWDGMMLKKKIPGVQMTGKDGVLDLTDVEVKGEFNDTLKSGPIISTVPHLVDNKKTGKDITYTDEYIDIGKIEKSLNESPILGVQIETKIMTAGIEEQKNYITNALNVTDTIDDDWFLKPKKDRVAIYKQWIIDQYLRSEGLLLGDPGSDEVLRNLNESGIKREITAVDAAIINKDKDENDPTRVEAGQEGYFIRQTKIPTLGTPGGTDTATHIENQRNALKTGGGNQFTIISQNKKRSIVNEGTKDNPNWVQYKYVHVGTTAKEDPKYPEVGSMRIEGWKWVKLGPTEQGYINPGSDQYAYQNFLQL